GVFTVTLNERNQGDIVRNLADLLLLNFSISSFAIRDIMDSPDVSYAQALELLSHRIKLIAPCYLILGGTKTGEGAVITRDPEAAVNVRKLDLVNGDWYLVETNYDSWTSPPPDDDRRNPAEKMLDSMGRDMDLTKLSALLDTRPVCNNDTLYTT
ncbi:hypothetical protein, partial [Salmonella sp. s51228]|uniref:hypothetical protein n=1 Tax=Salmonella sp. s51228 TaxID=3159652 RepID=UPI0039803F5A